MLKKQKAIFLDRDGTILKHIDHLTRLSEVRLLPRVAKAISIFNHLGYLVLVATNQAAVARGLITPIEVEAIHTLMVQRLWARGAKVHGIYYCPHYPEMYSGIPEHAIKYVVRCHCRKPASGMLLKAISENNIDPAQSFMIGDAYIDIVAGKNANCRTIMVKSGPGHLGLDSKYHHIKPDFVAHNLLEAAHVIQKI